MMDDAAKAELEQLRERLEPARPEVRKQGEVEFWNGTSYGFIRSDAGQSDVFFHVTELPEGQSVKRGDRVTFDIERDKFKPDKTSAVRVRRS
jgi:cold shock protein